MFQEREREKMSTPKVSAIIPVYNAEKYLCKALDSILAQTLDNIEIICVDDSSTDNSFQILKDYEQKDNRIKVLRQENSFAGVARNNGLKMASGDYVIFLDADDYFAPEMLEKMYKCATKTNAEITICKSQTLVQETGKITINDYAINKKYLKNKTCFTPSEISKYIFQSCVGWAWDKLYKRDFIIQNGLKFQALRHSNDTCFVLTSLVLANKIATVDEVFVTYRAHSTSLAKTRAVQPECFYYALKALRENLEQIGKYKQVEQSYINYCLEFWHWHRSTIQNQNSIEIINNYFITLLHDIEFSKHFPHYFYSQRIYRKVLLLYLIKFFQKVLLPSKS